jgi:predicted Holliday junction resolvase-like endonuclease
MTTAIVYLLVFVLTAGAVFVLLLTYRYWQLKSDLSQLAMSRFDAWRIKEIEAVRSQQMEVARREVEVLFQQWKTLTEQQIRQDAIQRSRAVTLGQITEHFIPYLAGFPYNPKDARFVGTPIDFIVFDGLSEGVVENIVFVEVKTGRSTLSTRERRVRDALKEGRVQWLEMRPNFELELPAGV